MMGTDFGCSLVCSQSLFVVMVSAIWWWRRHLQYPERTAWPVSRESLLRDLDAAHLWYWCHLVERRRRAPGQCRERALPLEPCPQMPTWAKGLD